MLICVSYDCRECGGNNGSQDCPLIIVDDVVAIEMWNQPLKKSLH